MMSFPKHWQVLAFEMSFSLTSAKTLESMGLLSSWCAVQFTLWRIMIEALSFCLEHKLTLNSKNLPVFFFACAFLNENLHRYESLYRYETPLSNPTQCRTFPKNCQKTYIHLSKVIYTSYEVYINWHTPVISQWEARNSRSTGTKGDKCTLRDICQGYIIRATMGDLWSSFSQRV